MEMIYQFSAIAGLVVAALAFMFWRHSRLQRATNAAIPNAAQNRLTVRFLAGVVVVAMAAFSALVFVPLPIGGWGYVTVTAAWLAMCAVADEWYWKRMRSLASPA